MCLLSCLVFSFFVGVKYITVVFSSRTYFDVVGTHAHRIRLLLVCSVCFGRCCGINVFKILRLVFRGEFFDQFIKYFTLRNYAEYNAVDCHVK